MAETVCFRPEYDLLHQFLLIGAVQFSSGMRKEISRNIRCLILENTQRLQQCFTVLLYKKWKHHRSAQILWRK